MGGCNYCTLLPASKLYEKDDKWLVIASSSSSRISVLTNIIKFKNTAFIPSNFEENLPKSPNNPIDYVQNTALQKAKSVAEKLWSGINPAELNTYFDKIITPFYDTPPLTENSTFPFVVGFDTIMYKNCKYYEKPVDREDAKNQISSLRGSTHQAISGIAIFSKDYGVKAPVRLFHESTVLSLKDITEEEIELILDLNEYEGSSGSYRIDRTGGQLSSIVSGSYTNIKGLPAESFVAEMNKLIYKTL